MSESGLDRLIGLAACMVAVENLVREVLKAHELALLADHVRSLKNWFK